MLISITDILDGISAKGNDINSRMATLLGLLNGNIDASNIAAQAITQAKIATGAVTSDKLAPTKSQDANGWTVYDHGTWKSYCKKATYASPGSIAGSQRTNILTAVTLPVGKTFAGVFIQYSGMPTTTYGGHASYGIEGAATASAFNVQLCNTFTTALVYSDGAVNFYCLDI